MDPAAGILKWWISFVPVKSNAVSNFTAKISTSSDSGDLMERLGSISIGLLHVGEVINTLSCADKRSLHMMVNTRDGFHASNICCRVMDPAVGILVGWVPAVPVNSKTVWHLTAKVHTLINGLITIVRRSTISIVIDMTRKWMGTNSIEGTWSLDKMVNAWDCLHLTDIVSIVMDPAHGTLVWWLITIPVNSKTLWERLAKLRTFLNSLDLMDWVGTISIVVDVSLKLGETSRSS